MNRASSVLTIVLALAFAPFPTSDLRAQASPSVQERVDQIFERWDSEETPGCAVGVKEGGATVLESAYGMADLEHGVPNTPETIFEAGSVSKQFTAAAVVLLAEDGVLSLDDDVRAHIPELPDYGPTITIRHLLTHTSGLRDWGSVAAITGWGREARVHDHDHVLDILVRQSALNFPPGDRYSYSNSGYNLLAMIVERAGGSRFADFSQERIFETLSLNNTEWRNDYTRIVPGRASAYAPRSGGGFSIARPNENVHGNGGLLTTVEDLLAWSAAIRSGDLGGPTFSETMHSQAVLNDGRTITYAAGLQVDQHRGVPEVAHTGSTRGYRAFLGHYPEQDLHVALLCNISSQNPGQAGRAVVDLFLGDVAVTAEAPSGIELAPEVLRETEGLYRNEFTGEPMRLAVQEGRLVMDGGNHLIPRSATEFQVGTTDQVFRFVPSQNGGPTRIRTLVGTFEGDEYLALAEFDPSAEELSNYAGRYHSEDAEMTVEVEARGKELFFHRRPADEIRLEPLYADAFRMAGTGLLVRFIRNDEGEVTEVSLRQARVYDLRFGRLD